MNNRIRDSIPLDSTKFSRQCTILHFEYVSQGMELTSDPYASIAPLLWNLLAEGGMIQDHQLQRSSRLSALPDTNLYTFSIEMMS